MKKIILILIAMILSVPAYAKPENNLEKSTAVSRMTKAQKDQFWANYVESVLDMSGGKMHFECPKEDNGLCYMSAEGEIKDGIVSVRHWFRKDKLDEAKWFEQTVRREQCFTPYNGEHIDCYDFETGKKTVSGLHEKSH